MIWYDIIRYDIQRLEGILSPKSAQVTELAEHFGLDERVTRLLDEEMKKRRKTFEEDLQALRPFGGFQSHGGTPSYHPFLDGIFHYKPAVVTGYRHLWKPPFGSWSLSVYNWRQNIAIVKSGTTPWELKSPWLYLLETSAALPSGKLKWRCLET